MQPVPRSARAETAIPSPRKALEKATLRFRSSGASSNIVQKIQSATTSKKRCNLIRIFYARVHSSEDIILETFNDLNLDARVDFYMALERKRELLFNSLKVSDALRLYSRLDFLEQVYLFVHHHKEGMGPLVEKNFEGLTTREIEDKLQLCIDVPFFNQLQMLKQLSYKAQYKLQHLIPDFWNVFPLYAAKKPQQALAILCSAAPLLEDTFLKLPSFVQILYINYFPELPYIPQNVKPHDWLFASKNTALRGGFTKMEYWQKRIAKIATANQGQLFEEYLSSENFVPPALLDLSGVKTSRKEKFLRLVDKRIRSVPDEIVDHLLDSKDEEIPYFIFGFSWYTTADKLLESLKLKLDDEYISDTQKAKIYLFLELYLKTKIEASPSLRVIQIFEAVAEYKNLKFVRAWTVWKSLNEMRSLSSSSGSQEEDPVDFRTAGTKTVAGDLTRSAQILLNDVSLGEFTMATPEGGATFKKLVTNWNAVVKHVKRSILEQEMSWSVFLEIARQLVLDRDYYSAYAIYAALQSGEVSRLGVKCVDLDELFSQDNNLKVLRDRIAEVKICVPPVSLFTKDLAFACENVDVLHGVINPSKLKMIGRFLYDLYRFQVVNGTNERKMHTTIVDTLMKTSRAEFDFWGLSHSQKPPKRA